MAERAYSHRGPQQHAAHPGSRPARPPLLHQHPRLDQLVGLELDRSVFEGPTIRVLDGVHERRAAADRRRAAARPSTCSPISTTCAASTRCAPACSSTAASYRSDDSSNYLGTYTFESLAAFQRRHAAQLHAPRRRSEHRLQERPGRRLSAGRHPGPQEPDRSAPASATSCRRTSSDVQQLRPAVRRHLVAGQERQDDAARQRRHLLRLAVDQHLRADAARRRLPPARAEHHQSVVPESRRTSRASRRRPTATCWATTCRCSASPGFSAGIDAGGHQGC